VFEIMLIVFITMSLTEIIKQAKLVKRRHVPLFTIACAVFVVAGYGAANISIPTGTLPHAATSGVLIGLISCGAYSVAKSLFGLIPAD